MADVFISYKREERQAVERLAQDLSRLGLDVWFDASLNAGEAFSDEIDREAHAAKAILVCWSPTARESQWVKSEALIGFEQRKLAACYIAGPDGFYPPTPFNSIHAEDLRAWVAAPSNTHAGYKSLLRRIGALSGRADIESYGALDVQAPPSTLRAWIERHGSSPLFMAVDELLRVRDVEEAERVRLEQEARERRASEEAERNARKQQEQRAIEEARRAEQEIAERDRLEHIRQQQDLAAKRATQGRNRLRLLMWSLAVAGGSLVAWSGIRYVTSLPTPEEREAESREAALEQTEHLAFTEAYLDHTARELRMGSGETLAGLLTRAGASGAEASAVLASLQGVYDPRRIRPGQSVSVFFSDVQLTGVVFRSEQSAYVTANRTTSGAFAAREVLLPLTFENAHISAEVGTSLYATALMLGATEREVAALAGAFSYDVQQVQRGDHFELVFERYYDDEGNTIRTGDLLFVALETRRGIRRFYAFLAPGENRPAWYDENGRAAASGTRTLSGRALELFHIERMRVDTLRRASLAAATRGQ